jgi:hypothetical protein
MVSHMAMVKALAPRLHQFQQLEQCGNHTSDALTTARATSFRCTDDTHQQETLQARPTR